MEQIMKLLGENLYGFSFFQATVGVWLIIFAVILGIIYLVMKH